MRNRYTVLLLIAGLIILIWVIARLDAKTWHLDQPAARVALNM